MRLFVVSMVLAASAAVCQAQPAAAGYPPLAQGVAWRGPQGDVALRPQMFFPNQDPHYIAFFADIRRPVRAPVSAIGRPQITESVPTFFVQGFGYGTDWELVKLERHHGQDVLFQPSRNMFDEREFFSDEPFAREDLLDLVQSSGGDVYTLRPAAALPHGAYLLCGKPAGDEGGWMRFCYDFEITGG